MRFEELKVGQTIQASKYSPEDIGIIKSIINRVVVVDWKLKYHRWADTCRNQDTFTQWLLIEQKTPEEKVKERIKKLWNQSNWVKKNPLMAY